MNTNRRGRKTARAAFARRLMSLALAAVMLWSLLPGLTPAAEAAEWMEPYLEKLVEWGVMRGSASGDLNPDRVLTRAEFVTMINRAFGYTERGNTPFQDVPENAWYADDINIAYQAGYFTGTSETTAGPLGRVTREQAAVLLGRNLRLQGIPGVNSDFTDVQQMGNWSRGLVQECAELGIIQGYADGTFRPKNYITRGQMACFLVRALGTLVHETGDQIAGGVYGNLTVNTSGVKLKDTVVTGNLYLSGGVGLGSVELENVTVMGKIVVCGAGEAERGESSIILRNVTAEAMEIDSLSDHFMTVRTEGLTNIANTTVRTSAYLEDVTDDDQGLRVITLDGTSDGALLQLAGNIKEVVNITPNSNLQVVQGITDKLTVDERATGSALSIANDTTVRVLNLDAGTPVTGNGDVSKMNVNAAGSTATMLPDTIFIRPGIESNIHNQVMDNKAAEESSDEPRLLAGYPLIRNLASTSADGVFSTNKRGTLYWAVSTLLDGSVGEDELRNPSAFPGKILRSGTINVTASKTEMTARLTGLSQEGSYYLSAILVDERGHTSPVKMTAFTTTDDSVPNFAAGYPEAILTVDPKDEEEQIIQARVMATKTCQLYYALLPRNSTAPTANALRAGAVTGNLGYGTMEVAKNRSYLISRVNTAHLAEETTYDLYFWLNDADNGKSSAVRRIQVTTKDMTPPVVTNIYQSKSDRTSAQITFTMSERADLYWVAVKAGETLLRPPVAGGEDADFDTLARTLAAKIQVESGGGNAATVNSGRTTAGQADTNYTFTISRLEEQGVYDLYYVAKDPAGNYSEAVKILENVMTTDATPPLVELEFSRFNEGANGVINPWVESDVTLVFNEMVRGTYKDGKMDYYEDFYDLYDKVATTTGAERDQAKNALARALRRYIRIYPGTPPTSGNPRQDPVLDIGLDKDGNPLPVGTDNPGKDTEPCWVDFREAVVTRTDGRLKITFPGSTGIKMQSGGTYFFRVENIVDASNNIITPNPTYLPRPNGFTTAFATVYLKNNDDENKVDGKTAKIFELSPEDTQAVPENTRWDMLIWTDSDIEYTLYVREKGTDTWTSLGDCIATVTNVPSGKIYNSLSGYTNFRNNVLNCGLFGTYEGRPYLRNLTREVEFAIVPKETTVEKTINMEITLLAGANTVFENISLAGQGQASTLQGKDVTHIGDPDPFPIVISPPSKAPTINVPYLGIEPGDNAASVQVQVDRYGTVYCMAVPLVSHSTDSAGNPIGNNYVMSDAYPAVNGGRPNLETIPTSRKVGEAAPMTLDADAPEPRRVINKVSQAITTRFADSGSDLLTTYGTTINLSNLTPNTTYLLYLASADDNGTPATNAICYRFTTTPPKAPVVQVQSHGNDKAEITLTKENRPASGNVWFLLVRSTEIRNTSFGEYFRLNSALVDPAAGTLPSGYNLASSSKTVLDAMLETVYDSENHPLGSVFDLYATQQAKSDYFDIFLRPNDEFQREPPVMQGDGENRLIQGTTGTFNLTGMIGTNRYTLLVAARGQNSTSVGFTADREYFSSQSQNLYIRRVSLDECDKDTYTGIIRINFSNPLYYIPQDGWTNDPIPVDSCWVPSNTHVGTGDYNIADGYVAINTTISGMTRGVEFVSPEPNKAHKTSIGSQLEFELTNVTDGAGVDFNAGLCTSRGDVRLNGAELSVWVRKIIAADGKISWEVQFSEGWDTATEQ